MRKSILYIFSVYYLAVLSLGCGHRAKIEKVLANNCFWDIYDERYAAEANTCWQFSHNNKCNYFVYQYGDFKQRSKFVNLSTGDNRPNTWKIINDTLVVRASTFKIINYNQDTIMLGSITSRDTIMLFKNCKTKSKN
jgi:hypothetical protein